MKTKILCGILTLATLAVTAASPGSKPDATPALRPDVTTSPAAPASVPPAVIKLANDSFAPASGYMEWLAAIGQQTSPTLVAMGTALRADARFLNETAGAVRRTTNSSPAGHIKCLVPPAKPGAAGYLSSLAPSNQPLQACRFVYHHVTTNSPLWGKRVRVSGWLKTKDVEVMAGASLVIINAEGRVFACDPMTDRPLRGTMDWMEFEMVADVPAEPCTLYLGPTLHGSGEIWADDFQIAVAAPDKAITDDRIWHIWSPNPDDYTMSTDPQTTREGRSTLCFSYAPEGKAPAGSWMWWGQCIRTPDQYRGHTVQMTVWIKTEKVSNRVRPNLRPKGPFFRLLTLDKHLEAKTIKGTTDWTQQTILCRIPEGTQCLDTGFAFNGSGRFWVDMKSLTYEIVD